MRSNQDFLAIVRGFRRAGGTHFQDRVDPFRKAAYGRRLKDVAQREAHPECGGDPCKHASGEKRMAAKLKEIVVDAKLRNPDQLGPYSREDISVSAAGGLRTSLAFSDDTGSGAFECVGAVRSPGGATAVRSPHAKGASRSSAVIMTRRRPEPRMRAKASTPASVSMPLLKSRSRAGRM